MAEVRVVLRGGGDLASGVALRLWRAGWQVAILESARPTAVRRSVALAEAIYSGDVRVEEMPGRYARTAEEALRILLDGAVPVLVDPDARSLDTLHPEILVDAIVAKRNTGTQVTMAPLVVALGPGFTAGIDVHAVVETNRGAFLGRVYWEGSAEPNTGEPGSVGGQTGSRVLRAPVDGVFQSGRSIGDIVSAGDVVGTVNREQVIARISGLLRGIIRPGTKVRGGMKVGDIDPRLDPALIKYVSDKALAVAGGVLEAILVHLRQNEV